MSPEYVDLVALRSPTLPVASRSRPPPPTDTPVSVSEARQTAAHAAALSEWDELGKVKIFPSGKKHDNSLFRLLGHRKR